MSDTQQNKRKLSDFGKLLAEHGATLLSTEWRGVMSPHLIRCANGHTQSVAPNGVKNSIARNHSICHQCSNLHPANAERRFLALLESINATLTNYKGWQGSRFRYTVTCSQGHLASATPDQTNRTNRVQCQTCGLVRRWQSVKDETWERFLAKIAELGGIVTEIAYLGSGTTHTAICAAGHLCNVRPGNILAGAGMCRACAGQSPELAWNDFQDRVSAQGGALLESQWLGSESTHRVICRRGHLRNVYPSSLRSGNGLCALCAFHWDIFYVLRNPSTASLKFGITTRDAARRFREHAARGYTEHVYVATNMREGHALELERKVRMALLSAGLSPLYGREYFPDTGLSLVMHVIRVETDTHGEGD